MDISDVLTAGCKFTHVLARHQDQTEILQLNDHALFGRLWPQVAERTYNDLFRVKDTLTYVELALGTPGDFIECGVGRGGTALLTALTLREHGVRDKKIFLCDSYAGLPAPDRRFDKGFHEGQYATPVEVIQRMIDEYDLGDVCVIKQGLFSETLGTFPPEQRFCFANIDCDIYPSAVDCIRHLHPRLSPGAPMQFDEYYNPLGGVNRAVNELVSRTHELVHLGPVSHGTIIRGMTEQNATVPFTRVKLGEHEVPLSTAHLNRDKLYNTFVTILQEELAAGLKAFEGFAKLCQRGPA